MVSHLRRSDTPVSLETNEEILTVRGEGMQKQIPSLYNSTPACQQRNFHETESGRSGEGSMEFP